MKAMGQEVDATSKGMNGEGMKHSNLQVKEGDYRVFMGVGKILGQDFFEKTNDTNLRLMEQKEH